MRNASLWTFVLVLLIPLAACGDDDSLEPIPGPGSISGEVVDTNGDPLSDVTVSATGPQDFQATTDTNGLYLFSDAQPGSYTVEITGSPEDVTCPTTTKSATVETDDNAIVDWECEGSA